MKGVEFSLEPDENKPTRVVFRFTGERSADEVTPFVSYAGGVADLRNSRPSVRAGDPPVSIDLVGGVEGIDHVGIMWTEPAALGPRFHAFRIRLAPVLVEEWRVTPIIGRFAPKIGRWVTR